MENAKNNRYDEFGGLANPKSSDDQILRQFKRKSAMARDWVKDLVENGYRKAVKTGRRRNAAHSEEGLFMSDEMQDVGVLSIAPALSALLSELALLREGKDVADGAASFTDALTADKNEVLDAVVNSVCKLIAECYPDGLRDGYEDVMLSSAPFYDGVTADGRSVWKRGGYLDSASWVFLAADLVEIFLNRLEGFAPDIYKKIKWKVYADEDEEVLSAEDVRKYIRNIYYASIRVTRDCIVKSDGKYSGWTFRRMKSDEVAPSLYFSYVASTVYLGLYKRFNGARGMINEMRKFETRLAEKKYDDICKYRYYDGFKSADKLEKTLEWMTRNGFDGTAKFLRGLTQNEIGELNLLYNTINDGKPLVYELSSKVDEYGGNGAFTELKEASLSLAKSLWNEGFGPYKDKKPFKENMAKGPCFEDGSLVDMEVVRLSSHNNAFFNNLFVIGIILNSAYDAELARTQPVEYEKMLNVFQLSIQNTQRCYDEIENDGLLYKIDGYILDFSDKVDADNAELAKQLRRVNMSVVPLMPLMLKNNNLMSEYIVRYPQKQMTEALKDIVKNRKCKDGASSWVWDKDGYNAITNYYYVDALISFYGYYERYEEPLIQNEEARRRGEADAIEDVKTKLETAFAGREKELNDKISQMDAGLKEYRRVFKDLARLMVNGLIDVVDEQLTAAKLMRSLSPEERTNRELVISALNSFDKDADAVKISSLVHLTEKLQVLSLLSMDSNEQLRALLKNGGSNKVEGHEQLLVDTFGAGGDSSKFMRNLIVYLMDNLAANKFSSDKKED